MREVNREDHLVQSLCLNFSALAREAQACRIGIGLILWGWFHLAIFGCCEILFLRGDRAAEHFLPLWALDVALPLVIIRFCVPVLAVLESASSVQIVLRVWLTFAILCMTSASLNSISGFQIDWFKISWAMLSTFAFATMAWLFHLAFVILAVQMSFTALLIAASPDHAYAIFGLSWFLALNVLGLMLERANRRRSALNTRTLPER